MTLPTQPYIHCTYAENIRHETTGQISIIGVFNSGKIMMPSDGGVTLPQLSVYLAIFIPSNFDLEGLKCELRFEGALIHSIDFPEPIITKVNDERKERLEENQEAKGFFLQTSFSFNNLHMPNPGVLRASTTLNSKDVIESNGLIFMKS